jgi:hypothetical protein
MTNKYSSHFITHYMWLFKCILFLFFVYFLFVCLLIVAIIDYLTIFFYCEFL